MPYATPSPLCGVLLHQSHRAVVLSSMRIHTCTETLSETMTSESGHTCCWCDIVVEMYRKSVVEERVRVLSVEWRWYCFDDEQPK